MSGMSMPLWPWPESRECLIIPNGLINSLLPPTSSILKGRDRLPDGADSSPWEWSSSPPEEGDTVAWESDPALSAVGVGVVVDGGPGVTVAAGIGVTVVAGPGVTVAAGIGVTVAAGIGVTVTGSPGVELTVPVDSTTGVGNVVDVGTEVGVVVEAGVGVSVGWGCAHAANNTTPKARAANQNNSLPIALS